MKNLFGIKNLSTTECENILNLASEIKRDFLNGKRNFYNLIEKTFLLLFFEDSTRTRISFEAAVLYLGGKTINISISNSSIQKGESLVDTIKTIDRIKIDGIIVRSSFSGFPNYISKFTNTKIINAGDGIHEHPTQALLDFFTLKEKFKTLNGLIITIIGDILHSRVARSAIFLANKLGVKIRICGPNNLIPKDVEKFNVQVFSKVEEAIYDCDAVMGLRIQSERQNQNFFSSCSEFSKIYGINSKLLSHCKKNIIIMHPGPANRGVEISQEILDSENCLKDIQVENGVFVRMAILGLLK